MKSITLILLIIGATIGPSPLSASESTSIITFEELRTKHIGQTLIIQTDIMVIVGLGSVPPEGMIIMSKRGNVYTGRLDAISKDTVTISAAAGVPSEPEYRKTIQIERKHIKQIRIPNEAVDSTAARVTPPAEQEPRRGHP